MSARATVAISDDVRRILAGVEIDGTRVRIVEKLDRLAYERVDKALRMLGGRWVRKDKAHVFDADPTTLIRGGADAGGIENLKTKYQFFETPEGLAREMVAYLQLRTGERVLEPEAGRGRLVKPCLHAGAFVTAIDIWDANIPYLEELLGRDRVTCCDFLQIQPLGRRYDAIAMNPPFANRQAISHIRHAYDNWLSPQGRMVALCDPGALTNGSAAERSFQLWLNQVRAEVREVPPGTFEESGTRISAKLLIIGKARAV